MSSILTHSSPPTPSSLGLMRLPTVLLLIALTLLLTLTQVTATNGTDTATSPDWSLLGIMIALIISLVVLIVVGLYFFQTHSWGTGSLTPPTYRELALQENLDIWNVFTTKGTVRSVDNVSKGLVSLMSPEAQLKELTASKAVLTAKKVHAHNASMEDEDGSMGGASAGLNSDGSDVVASVVGEWEDAGLGGDPNDQNMNELSSHLDLEGFDFHSLYKMLDATKASVEGYFEHQEDGLKVFYERMALEIDHLKNILAVKMQVQLHKTGEGLSEAVDRLVSGELLARQAFQDLSRRRELELTKTLEQLVTCIRNLNEDYNIFPIKELVRLTNEHIVYCERGLEQERNRRKIFASHTEIVGRPIVDALSKADMNEEPIQDQYVDALKMFEAAVNDLLKKMLMEEQNHASAMEKLDESSTDKRKLELDRFHLTLCKLTKEIQQQLSYLDENLTPIFESLREMEDKTHHVWVHVQGELLESRWATLLNPVEGRLFRGINPELAKVLTGLLGMKGGLTVDPITGTFQPKTPFDPTDPFETIFDYQAVERLQREEEEFDTDSDGEEGGGRARRKKKKHENSLDGTIAPAEPEVVLRKKKKKTDSMDADADGGENEFGTGRHDISAISEGNEDDGTMSTTGGIGGGLSLSGAGDDDVKSRALAELAAKRRAVEEDDSLSPTERSSKLAQLDAEFEALKKLFGEDSSALIDAFKKSQQGRNDELDEDEAEIARLKAELLQKHAELQQLEATHTQEEQALLKQLDREDAEAEESFAVDMSKFDDLLHSMDSDNDAAGEGEDGGRAGVSSAASAALRRTRKNSMANKSSSSSSIDEERGVSGAGSVLDEYATVIDDMVASGASEDSIKIKMAELHAAKREQLRAKRLEALKKKQENEAGQLKSIEEETKEKLQAQVNDQSDMAEVLEVLKSTETGADGSSGESGSTGGSSGSNGAKTGQALMSSIVDAPVDPEVAAEFERERISIERRYKRQQLEREARNAVQEAFEFAKLEFRQDLMAKKRIEAKALTLTMGDDGLDTGDEVRNLMKGVDADRQSLESAQELERARQKKKLQEAMEARKKQARDKSNKKKELELRAAQRQLEQANKANVQSKEQQKIEEAIARLPEGDRAKLGKKVIELVMGGRHNKEIENVMGDHIEERQAFILEAMDAANAAGQTIDFIAIDKAASDKFDVRHAHEIADLIRQQQMEVRESYGKVFQDATFEGDEWKVKEGNELDEYAAHKRKMNQRKAAAMGGEDGVSDSELKKMAEEAEKKQRAHEARLKAEQDELDRMQREFDAKQAEKKAKREALEEEQKRRELDLLDDLSDAQREDILKQHKLNLKNFERATDNEKVRQAMLLEKALAERRRQLAVKKAQQKAAIEKKKAEQKEIAKREKKKLIQKLQKESAAGTAEGWKLHAVAAATGGAIPGLGPVGRLPKGGSFTGSAAGDDIDLLDDEEGDDAVTRHKRRLAKDANEREELKQKQEVVQRLRTIETMVEKLNSQSEQWRGQIYIDEKDLKDPTYQPVGTEVTICNVNELDPRSLVLYRFGVNLLEVFFAAGLAKAPTNGINNKQANTPIHLLIAATLPPNIHQQTAFRNSFHFQLVPQPILFIRRERLQDVGEFLLLLTHCLAHIATSARTTAHAGIQSHGASGNAPVGVVEGWDDRNPAFVQTFHAMFKFVSSDIFYAQSQKALQIAPHVLPLVQPMTSKPISLEPQVEGSSSSSSSNSSTTLVGDEIEAWLGKSIRNVAIDEVLDFHPISGLDGSQPNGNPVAGAHQLHHSSHYSTARMLERLHEYQSFAHATVLKNNLIDLESHARSREHARELKESRSFRQRAVRGVPPPTSNDDKSWQEALVRSGQQLSAEKLQEIEDELTAELTNIAEQLYQHTHALHQTERDIKDLKVKPQLSAADQSQLAKFEASVNTEKSVINQLNHHKDHCIYRLRNIQAAAVQLEGGTAAESKENE